MKLVRYGAKGAEKPGLIDKSGQLRDLSAHVKDLDGEAYAPASLAKLAAPRRLQASRRRRQAALRRAGHRHLEIRRHRPELCRPRQGNRHRRSRPSRSSSSRPTPRCRGPNDAVEKPRGSTKLDWEVEIAAIIGTRAKYVSRSRRAQPRRRLLRLQRRLRAQFPDRARRPVDQGQVARHLRPGRPVARHQGRNPRRAEARRCGSTSTASAARPARPRP